MTKMIDSKKEKLNFAEIAGIAFENTRLSVPKKFAMTGVLAEVNQPDTDVKQIGNTVFILHEGKNGQGFFKALNADTAANFVANSKKYVVYAKNEMQIDMLVTEFTDPAISKLFHTIAKAPPMPGMGFKEYKKDNGGFRIVLNLGK